MRWSRVAAQRLRAVFRRAELERDVDDELRFHIEMQTAENLRRGMTPEEARRQAVVAFGGVEGHREAVRDVRRPRLAEDLWGDARYGARALRRNPVFAGAAILTLALGVGVATAVFGVADQLFFRPLPVEDPDRVVSLSLRVNEEMTVDVFDPRALDALASGSRELVGVVGSARADFRMGPAGATEKIPGAFVSAGYFDLLGITPELGRDFSMDGAPEVILSHGLWGSRYGADPAIVGETILLEGHAFTVAGVAPKDFTTERLGHFAVPQLWVPLSAYPLLTPAGRQPKLGPAQNAIGRLRDGATPATAAAELTRMLPAAPALDRLGWRRRVEAAPLDPVRASRRGAAAKYVGLLGLATGVVLLLAAINVAGMLLARSVARAPEIAVRLALGASRGRIVRQLLSESAVLFVLGGGCGVLVAAWLSRAIAVFPWQIPLQLEESFDARAVAFGVAITSLAGLAAALLPALQAARPTIHPALTPLASGRPRRTRMRNAVVIAQVALSLLLVISSGLFLRALERAWSTDLGYDPHGLAMARLDLPPEAVAALDAALTRVRELPGVTTASLAEPIAVGSSTEVMAINRDLPEIPASFAVVSPGHVPAMGIDLLRGRDLDHGDVRGAPRVALVSASLARTLWPGEDPIGRSLGEEDPIRVVGVVSDVRISSIDGPPRPTVYLPLDQAQPAGLALYLRISGDPAPVYRAVQQTLDGVAPGRPRVAFESVEGRLAAVLLPQRVGAWLAGGFGAFALGVAAIGLYGVLAYGVLQRRREIGIRMALGADRIALIRRYVWQGLVLAAVGISIGIALALGATRLVGGLLYGVSPADPLTYAVTAGLVSCVMAVASLLPARQAANVDPAVALRAE